MLKRFVLGAAVAACGWLSTAPIQAAATSVINFDDLAPFTNGALVPAGYGNNLANTPNVTVGYNTLNGDGSFYAAGLQMWNAGYGDLSHVALANTDTPNNTKIAEITLSAAAGFQVQLQSFLLAGWLKTDNNAAVLRVLDGAGHSLWSQSNTMIFGNPSQHSPAHSAFTFAPNLTASTLRIQWGTNFNIGIDEIVFSQIEGSDPPAVPEPAGLAMMSIGGAAAALAAARRKRG